MDAQLTIDVQNAQFIDHLIDRTKMQQIKWDYLCSNEELCSRINLVSDKDHFGFNVESSCFCEDYGCFIILYVVGYNPSELYIVNQEFSSIAHISASEHGDRITRLLNMAHHNMGMR